MKKDKLSKKERMLKKAKEAKGAKNLAKKPAKKKTKKVETVENKELLVEEKGSEPTLIVQGNIFKEVKEMVVTVERGAEEEEVRVEVEGVIVEKAAEVEEVKNIELQNSRGLDGSFEEELWIASLKLKSGDEKRNAIMDNGVDCTNFSFDDIAKISRISSKELKAIKEEIGDQREEWELIKKKTEWLN